LGRMQQMRHCRLLLVTGGAGFGKTTLVAQWRIELLKAGAAVAWLSLLPDDADLPALGAHFIGALQHQGVSVEGAFQALNNPQDEASARNIVAVIVNAVARLDIDLHLVIDDFHHVTDPSAVKLVQMLLDAAPPNLHLVLASRSVPGMALGRLRALGMLGEIG